MSSPLGRRDSPPELWAGVECTVNRVGDLYFDQMARSGHATRFDDLDRIAELGVRTVRYPILWERVAPRGVEHADWSWADRRLARLRELGITPIVGLVHHGSGPRGTSLLDPRFPERLARYARAVAERYPWLSHFTPVNEPLTTARFAALYGHWYPHARDALSFSRALLHQCRAVALAMRAIREVIPDALLVQTEDLGKTYGTPRMQYQADFENVRRWLTFDTLCGRVDRSHPMWAFFRWAGLREPELARLLETPCPPDVLGVNHYLTSERFLDERLERYPEQSHGDNGRHRYADVEAVRVCADGPSGLEPLLREAWTRYRLPLAVTEVHLGCTREQQLRWLAKVWEAARRLRADGVDVRAVTAWSTLGAFDWASLMTRVDGLYEPGLFDVRGPAPRPTALAAMARDLATTGSHHHPALDGPGWWEGRRRLLYPPVSGRVRPGARSPRSGGSRPRRPQAAPLLITGAGGTLGRALGRVCEERRLAYRLLSRRDVDITDAASVEAALEGLRPWAVVNAAGYVRVDDAENDRERCFRENADGPAILAAACARRRVALATFSSDLVFDGRRNSPYVESDRPSPLSVYGASKAAAEARVLELLPSALVARTSAFFGPWDEYNFATRAMRGLAAGLPLPAADDAIVSPTYVPDLAHATLDLLIDGAGGVWHLANAGVVSWAEFARQLAEQAGLDASLVEPRRSATLGLVAPRPGYSALGSERGELLPALEGAIQRYLHARDAARRRATPEHDRDPQLAEAAEAGGFA